MKKKLSKYELLLLVTISIKADTTEFAQGSFDVLEEMNLIENNTDEQLKDYFVIAPKGESFVKSLLKVKMPKQVWR